ncbi:metalloregulator ArsR/SmtB family transcription factor [Phenylobacterium sp.]|uniref:metalloregulator ArsR/SmtB family transcription factor n=1 Tax=Phenylobacterium sp. TaxID=1871053 RepID=UPI0035B2F526
MTSVFKALSHPARRQIVAMLREGPMASGDIAQAFDMAWPSITGHLTALKEAGLVETERAGASIRYRLNISALEEAVAFLMEIIGTGEAAESLSQGKELKSP